ncbi:hypothetical protein, partial [Brachybacterium tyrofermentans]|uniref:hypothetical protein n=1 Tax=Brachybacterium tyrofermentans TaxID=47848 RepID=UPI001D01D2CA
TFTHHDPPLGHLNDESPRLVSNIGDEHHRTEHESLLRTSYEEAGVAGRLETIDIDLGPGHRAPNNDVYGDLMARIYETI